MKKSLSVLCLVLALVLCCLPAAAAAEVGSQPIGKVYAVAETESGKTVKTAVPDADKMDNLESYSLYIEKEPVLSVGSTEEESTGATVIPKFYSVKFTVPETTDEVFIAGLRAGYVEQIQQAIIDSYLTGESFSLTDLGFIDTEKTEAADRDDQLCWAASASNMLTYTGWAAKAGFQDEDEVFETFAQEFSNGGGHQHDGLAWFFNGASLRANLGILGTKILRYPNSGAYLKSYAYDMVCDYESLQTIDSLNRMNDYLQKGYGIGLGILLFDTQNHSGSHAITLWGTVVDTSLDKNDPKRFKSLLVTDSDSDFALGDRRDATDSLTLYHLTIDDKKRFAFHYYDDVTAALDDYIYLMPYSKNVPRETDLATPRDKTRYPDLAVIYPYIKVDREEAEEAAVYESGQKITFSCNMGNTADKRYRANAVLETTLTDQNGNVLLSDSQTQYLNLNYVEYMPMQVFDAGKLPAGDYTLKFLINPKHTVTEAYYYNNTRSLTLKLRDSYLSGDFNGDGMVDIQDATDLQRFLAEYTESDAKAQERGNLNGGELNISDVTELQRSLAGLPTSAAAGEKMLHNEI